MSGVNRAGTYGVQIKSDLSGINAPGGGVIKNFKQRGNVETYAAGSGTGGWTVSAVGTLSTWQQIIASRGKPYAVRVGYYNPTASPWTIDKTTIAPSGVYNSSTNMDPTGTPINVLFGGSASVTVPATDVTAVDKFSLSDWTPVVPADRTDVPGAYYLWYLRSLINATSGYVYGTSGSGGPGYPGNVPAGLIRQTNFNPADRITTPTGFTGGITSGGNPGFHLPVSVEFRSLASCLRVISVGDSITANGNQGGASGSEFTSFAERAVNIVNNQSGPLGRFLSHQNFGVGSQSLPTFYARMKNILAAYPADVVIIPAWTPNSAVATQAAFDAQVASVLDAIATIISYNAVPILWTSPPFGAGSPTVETYRLKSNALLRNLALISGITVIDFDVLVTDNATPVASWIPAYVADVTTHPNAAGNVLFANALAPALSVISMG